MKDIDELYEIINSINSKLNQMTLEKDKIAEIKLSFTKMDIYQTTLIENYNLFDESLTTSISKIKNLNEIMTNELLTSYSAIYKELTSTYNEIMGEIAGSANNIKPNIAKNALSKLGDSDATLPRLGELNEQIPKLDD